MNTNLTGKSSLIDELKLQFKSYVKYNFPESTSSGKSNAIEKL